MATTTTTSTMNRSPAYVPRSSVSSRPASPGLPLPPASLPPIPLHNPLPPRPTTSSRPNAGSHTRSPSLPSLSPTGGSFTPRMVDMEKRGSSHLRHEVHETQSGKRIAGERGIIEKGKKSLDELSEGAKSILKALSNLPAPLPADLPPNFLPSPNPTPSPPDRKSFADWARSLDSEDEDKHTRKRKSSPEGSGGVGLGLGLSMSTGSSSPSSMMKKQKTTSPPYTASSSSGSLLKSIQTSPKVPLKSPELTRSVSSPTIQRRLNDKSMSSSTSAAAASMSQLEKSPVLSKNFRRGSLKSDLSEGMGSWTKEQFLEAGQNLRSRALLCKRHGDAYSRSPTAQSQFVKQLPADRLRGLLCLTDAVLLWLFAYWLEEQTSSRIRASPYNESHSLREFVRKGWESEMRKAEDEEARDRAKAMVGLMYLIEAVVCYHLNTEQLAHLTRKTKELSNSVLTGSSAMGHNSSAQGPSPPSSNGSPGNTGPSPAAHSTTSQNASGSPESHTSCVNDLLPIISTSTSSTHRAHQYLLNSRHHLSLKTLRTRFPETFDAAIHSELADEALPAPGDLLGSSKTLDIDVPERFAWPIELGMHCPVGHTAVFGRAMVSEYGRLHGEWNLRLE